MEVTIRPKNFKLQETLETQVRKRVERISRQLENLESCEVLVTQEPTRFNAQRIQYVVQLTLRTRNNNLIRSEVADADPLAAVDQAIDHLSRQIERFKGRFYQKKKGKQGVGKSSAEVVTRQSVEPLAEAESAVAIAPVATEDELGDIVRIKRFAVRPMHAEEAIEEMELLGHNFFVFYNAGDEQLNVLYRRTDGNYGLLQPEIS